MATLFLLCVLIFSTFAESQSASSESSESSSSESQEELTDHWLEVPLDHFNLFDNRTWRMRYLINDEFFKEGQPLFIEIGGEWTITGDDLFSGQMYRLAKEHHGMLVETEHRYYGKSLPFSTDFSTENLKYLQIEQALEDLAYFIDYFKANTSGLENSQVIVHGCSYAGMLATWLRLKFANLVNVAYASSAPLGVGLDYPEYYEVVNDVYANVSGECIDTIRQGFNETEKLLKTKEGRKYVRNKLRNWNCGNVTEMNSLEILTTMRDVLNTQDDPVKYEEIACQFLKSGTNSTKTVDRLMNMVVKKSQELDTCETDESEEDERNSLAWNYQTCTEMGTFQTLNRENSKHPFAVDSTVQESVEECEEDFGEMVTEDILRRGIKTVTRRYGGIKPKVTQVVTVQGTNDPWSRLSSMEDYNPEAPVIVVQGSHCADINESQQQEQLVLVRRNIREIISKWIKN